MGPSDFSVSLIPLGTDWVSEHLGLRWWWAGLDLGRFGTKTKDLVVLD